MGKTLKAQSLLLHEWRSRLIYRNVSRGDGNRRKGDQRPGIIVLHLAELQRQEDVDESRNDRDVKHIAEKHRDPCEPAAGTVGDKQFTLPGGVTAACQQRDDLKPRPLIRQAGKPEQNRKQFRDDPVDQNDERE